jgi:hypothetical protein
LWLADSHGRESLGARPAPRKHRGHAPACALGTRPSA